MASANVSRPDRADISIPACGTQSIRILLVEDEQFLRRVIRRVLSDAGYEVIAATNAREALDQFSSCNGHIDLLIADVILPGWNGVRLAAELMQQKPSIKTVMISGYPERVVRNCQKEASSTVFYLSKPFTTEILTRKVHDVMSSDLQSSMR